MTPKRRPPHTGDRDDMRLQMIHARTHGPHRHRTADACVTKRTHGHGTAVARRRRR